MTLCKNIEVRGEDHTGTSLCTVVVETMRLDEFINE